MKQVLVVILIGGAVCGLVWGGWLAIHASSAKQVNGSKLFSDPFKTSSNARVQVPEQSYNFGTMDQQETGKHVFQIANAGSEPLALQVLEASCGCTRVKIKDLEWDGKVQKKVPSTIVRLAPGEETGAELQWETAYKSGPFSTQVILRTSDPKHREIKLRVEGEIVPIVELSHSKVIVEEAKTDQETTASFYVTSTIVDDLQLRQINTSNPLVTVTFKPMGPDLLKRLSYKSGYMGTIHIAPGMPYGPFKETLVIGTNVPKRPELTVDVIGRVRGVVLLTPWEKLNFKIIRLGQGGTLRLFIKIGGDQPVQAKVSKVTPEFIQARVEPLKSGRNRFQLVATVPPDAPGGNIRGAIEIQTTHPTARLIKIPVRGQVVR